jgi:hypothetical protein
MWPFTSKTYAAQHVSTCNEELASLRPYLKSHEQ